jgi:hypothetical protein
MKDAILHINKGDYHTDYKIMVMVAQYVNTVVILSQHNIRKTGHKAHQYERLHRSH